MDCRREQLLRRQRSSGKEISASSEELFALVSLPLDACQHLLMRWAQYKRQGLGGYEMLPAVLAEVGLSHDQKAWLTSHLAEGEPGRVQGAKDSSSSQACARREIVRILEG